jgi:ATP-binding cassette, subfamily B, bacterial MsbA
MADPNPSYKLLLPLLRRHRKAVIVFVAVILTSLAIEGLGVGAVISMLDAWGDGGIVDRIPILSELRSQVNALTLTQRVRLVAMVLLAVVVADSVLQYAKNMLSLRLSISVDAELKSAFIKQVYAVSLRYINQQSSSHLASMLLAETTQAARLLFLIATIVASLVVLAMYAIIMLAISWKLTLLATGLLCIFAIPSRLLVPVSKLNSAGGAIVASRKQLYAITSESLTSVKLAHLYSQEQARIRLVNEAANDYLHDLQMSNENVCRTKPLLNIFAVVGLVSLLVAGSFFAESGDDSWLASTSVFLLIVFRLLGPATALNTSHAQLANLFPSFVSVHNFLNRADKPYTRSGNIKCKDLKNGIQFDNVSFRYDEQGEPALRNLSFEIPYGKKTAIVGASGSGKSTIINLLARLYDPDEGVIRADSIDLRELETNSWRQGIAVVSQENLLFHSSVLENLKYSRPNATDEEAFAAAKLAQIDDFVQQLPNGYDTIIGDQGILISGGQRQRLAIARALIADPKFLIMDEATSALDSETERLIQESVELYTKGRTALISAHRLSTVRDADNIIVLSNGSIVEQGTHIELMAYESHYKQLVQAQNAPSSTSC